MLERFKGKLIVSCQALEDEPLHSSFIMSKMALAAKEGGAVAIRAQGALDIIAIKKEVNLPVIGLIKKNYPDSEIYITPTKTEVVSLIESGCEIIALDMTNRTRPLNEKVEDLIRLIKKNKRLVMADISTYEEGILAEKLGADCVSTTLSGYTSYSPQELEPDFKLISKLSNDLKIPVIAEGRIHYPYQLKKAFENGAYSAVIGGAITRPQEITKRFVQVLTK